MMYREKYYLYKKNYNKIQKQIAGSDFYFNKTLETTDIVTSVAYSPDGKNICSGSGDNTIKIWNSFSGKCIKTLGSEEDGEGEGHTDWINSVAYSPDPDGKYICSGSCDKSIKIWNTDHNSSKFGECIKTLGGHTDEVNSVAYSPDGKNICSGSSDATIKIWETFSGKCIKTLEGKGWYDLIMSVVYSPDGENICSGSNDNTIKIWNTFTGECIKTLGGKEEGKGHTRGLRSVAYSRDGEYICSGSYDATIKIWDSNPKSPNFGECIKTLVNEEGHTKTVYSVAYSSDGENICSGSADNTIKIWNNIIRSTKAAKHQNLMFL